MAAASSAIALPAEVAHLVRFLQTTVGRDQLNRIAAFGSKFLAWFIARRGGNADTIKRIANFSKTVTMSRKLFRILRPLEFVQALMQALSSADDFQRVTGVVRNAALALWLYFDMLEWLNFADAFKVADVNAVKQWSARCWLLGLILGVMQSAVKLQQLHEKARAKKAVDAAMKTERANAITALVKNSVDMLLPATTLGLTGLEDGHVGLAGVFTSLIGAMEQWKKT